MPGGDETRETYRFAEDDDSDDLGGFGRGKRSYDDDEDEENGGWAINEDHSDRLWDWRDAGQHSAFSRPELACKRDNYEQHGDDCRIRE